MDRTQKLAADDAPMICGSEEVPLEFRRIYYELVTLIN